MTALVVECLRCGTTRTAWRDAFKHLESPECPHCGYLGWAPLLELTDGDRPVPEPERRIVHRLSSVA